VWYDRATKRPMYVFLFDPDGRRYLDCISAYSAVNQGHCHPRIHAALIEQAGKVTLTSRAMRNDRMGAFLRKLTEFAGYDKALPMNTGAEAVENAIKIARAATGRSAVQSASPAFTVHIARVRTDPETGAFQLTGYAAIQDVGRAINPPEAEGQVHGGSVQSIGRALGEQLVYDSEGQLQSGSFLDYELPTMDQVPLIDVELVEVPSPVGPLGAKGVGEPPAIPGPAALTNALARATGIRIREVPVDRSALVR